MKEATIGWGWPSRDAAALDDAQLAGLIVAYTGHVVDYALIERLDDDAGEIVRHYAEAHEAARSLRETEAAIDENASGIDLDQERVALAAAA